MGIFNDNQSRHDTGKTVEQVTVKIEKLYLEEEVYERVKKVISEQLSIDINDITPTYCVNGK